ncbi:MAG TPA: prepilin-type N-terminal cleavage/methylation domain-containing protein [Bryobacteraceae bacterium]|nr:prepilin-type N-terminal cleavage/methylation domain-containing protein [Bryobacteraceae bacterium]
MKARSTAGMTLLEVIIAISLLSLLTVGVTMALRLGLSALAKTNDRLMSNRRVTGAQRVLEQQLQGFMPVVALYGEGERPGQKTPFFQGEPQSMRLVSSYSLQEGARGSPKILEFRVIPGQNGKGVRLIVNEHPYTGPASAGVFCLGRIDGVFRFRPIEAGSLSFVLADRLEHCRFSYQEAPPAPPVWTELWILDKWPGAIRIDMGPLDDDVYRLRPVSVTARVHVNRAPVFEYGDYAY